MRYVDGLDVHQWTAPDDVLEPLRLALPHCRLRDAALAEGTVEPDTADAALGALVHQPDRDLGMRGNDEPVDGTRDGGEIGKTPHALDFGGGGIDGNGHISGVAQLAIDGIGWLLAASRHAGDGDAFAAKEIGYGIWKRDHASGMVKGYSQRNFAARGLV